jgi:hypothetical protein
MAFDRMIEKAAYAPRRFGLAPKSADIFPTEAARLAKRKEYFKTMDKEGKGLITFNDWLDYALAHIVQKVKDNRNPSRTRCEKKSPKM